MIDKKLDLRASLYTNQGGYGPRILKCSLAKIKETLTIDFTLRQKRPIDATLLP